MRSKCLTRSFAVLAGLTLFGFAAASPAQAQQENLWGNIRGWVAVAQVSEADRELAVEFLMLHAACAADEDQRQVDSEFHINEFGVLYFWIPEDSQSGGLNRWEAALFDLLQLTTAAGSSTATDPEWRYVPVRRW